MTQTKAFTEAFTEALASLEKPVQFFIDHGLFDRRDASVGYSQYEIGEPQVRRVARQVAKELKRPFIVCNDVYRYWEYDPTTNSRTQCEKPVWSHGYIEIPRRKALTVLVTPLLLAASEKTHNKYRAPRRHDAVVEVSRVSLWAFSVHNKELWSEYKAFLMNDPDARAARKAPPLTA